MDYDNLEALWQVIHHLYKPHPWHGVDALAHAPKKLHAFVEIVPTDTVKYELDKTTGFLSVDRPQKFSNVCPSLYGFVPRTYCGDEIGAFCGQRTGRSGIKGDGDPLDICILTEKALTHGDVLVWAIPIGGLRMIDRGEADDKIVAVLEDDAVYGALTDIERLPEALLDRLKHYFLTYKKAPDRGESSVSIPHVYGHDEAWQVIRKSHTDYERKFSQLRAWM